jgi:LPXTG-site transpeptidase (sortase) family protein
MKSGVSGFWLYVRIALLNLAVVGMFVSVSQTPPPPVFRTLSVVRVPKQMPIVKSGIPNQIVINSLGMDLAVGVGSFNPQTGTWTIDDTKAYYADVSIPVNDKGGTTVIYGHNRRSVFTELNLIQPGAQADIYTDNGYHFRYVYQSMREVLPSDTSIFQDTGKPVLLLLTCSGGWDTYRSLFQFNFESVDRS